MEIELDILADLTFDVVTSLKVIEKDSDLLALFRFDNKNPIADLLVLAESNELDEETFDVVKAIFNGVILTKQEYVDSYQKLDKRDPNKPEFIPAPPVKKVFERKAVAENKLPRRYGKKQILIDIEKQGGNATPTQRSMLKVNDLKNIVMKLYARGVKDMLTDTRVLTDDEARQITAAITIVEQKLDKILKPKK